MTTRPLVQIAIDVTEVGAGLELARDAVQAGADWLEVGYPLIKFEGMHVLRAIRDAHPDAYILADLMILSGSEKYVRRAASTGVNNITVTGLAPDYTVAEAIALGRAHRLDVTVDLFNKPEPVQSALKYQEMGATHVMVHFGTDEKRQSPHGSPLQVLRDVVAAVSVPVSYATYDADEAVGAVESGASIIVQGAPLISAEDRVEALAQFIQSARGAARRERT